MTQSINGKLIYRASSNSFTADAFHGRCDGKSDTITIIRTNTDYVFGGYASSAWNSLGAYIEDKNAFIFSLRRNGVSKGQKFAIKNPRKALIGHFYYGPIFGGGNSNALNKHCYGCGHVVSFNCGHVLENYSYVNYHNVKTDCDIFLRDSSNDKFGCEVNLGHTYQCPDGYTCGQKNTTDYLAGETNNWLTTEIEVYQIIRN